MSKRLLQTLGPGYRRGKVFLVGAMAGLSISTLALGQTAAPTAPGGTSGPIGPGSTGSISPAGGVKSTATDAPHKVLARALSPQTRKNLQEAMDSAPPVDTANPAPPVK